MQAGSAGAQLYLWWFKSRLCNVLLYTARARRPPIPRLEHACPCLFWRAALPLLYCSSGSAAAALLLRHRITSTAGVVLLLPSPHPTVSRLVGVWQFASTFSNIWNSIFSIFLSNNESVCLSQKTKEDTPSYTLTYLTNSTPSLTGFCTPFQFDI